MAIDLCSEISSPGISPRISFSHDLKNNDDESAVDPHEDHRRRRPDSGSDFVFCISGNGFPQELSTADELFSDGKIVPTEVKKPKFSNPSFSNETHHHRSSMEEKNNNINKKKLIEFLNDEEDQKPQSRSFWQFKRSSSLNLEATRGKSLIRSFQFLSRSNSTGSVVNNNNNTNQKETQKQRILQKQSSVSSSRRSSSSCSSSSSSSSNAFYLYNSCQTQNHSSLKKKRSCGCSSSGSNGVRINPVLNLPQAYIPKAYVGFFGFGSLFCNPKINNKKK